MKIICESCGAKYSIADEKVAGKVFKIRCKKCSEVIVVRGDQPEETEEETRVFDYGSDAAWHVVVDGEQQGPLTPGQIGDLLADGRIDWEAFVWREGFDNWQPAKDVETLVAAVMAESDGGDAGAGAAAAAAGGAAAGAAAQSAYAQDSYGGGEQAYAGDMGDDPFASEDDGGLSGLVDQPVASASPAGGSADLFAGVAGSDDFSGGEPDPAPSAAAEPAASPRVSEADAMTGTRNENSVLFSLSNLQALATSSGSSSSAAPAPSERPGMAQGEGSGLIDIRALASASQAVKDGSSGQGGADQVEDLLAVGGGGSSFSAAALAAPVAAEKPESGNKLVLGLVAALGVLVLGLGGVVVAILMKDDPQQTVASAAEGSSPAPAAAAAAAPVPSAAAAEAAKPAKPADDGAEESEEEPEQRAAAGEDEDEDEADRDRDRDRDRHRSKKRRSKSSRSDSKSSSTASSKPDPEPQAKAKAKPSRNSGNSSIDDLLSGALGGKSKPARKSRPSSSSSDSNLPNVPDRNAVKNALQSVSGAVASCGGGQSGVAMTKITVSGKTGRVTNAVVSGQFSGSPVGSCVAKKVRGARFPKFKQNTFSVSYPYRL